MNLFENPADIAFRITGFPAQHLYGNIAIGGIDPFPHVLLQHMGGILCRILLVLRQILQQNLRPLLYISGFCQRIRQTGTVFIFIYLKVLIDDFLNGQSRGRIYFPGNLAPK